MTKRSPLWGEPMDTKGFTVTTKPDELWEKYKRSSTIYNLDVMTRKEFLAALSEYGQHIGEAVRKRDAEIALELHAGEQDDITRDAKFRSAAAIEREPLP